MKKSFLIWGILLQIMFVAIEASSMTIEPNSGYMGDKITIKGAEFETYSSTSYIEVGNLKVQPIMKDDGITPDWSDTKIVFKIPNTLMVNDREEPEKTPKITQKTCSRRTC